MANFADYVTVPLNKCYKRCVNCEFGKEVECYVEGCGEVLIDENSECQKLRDSQVRAFLIAKKTNK